MRSISRKFSSNNRRNIEIDAAESKGHQYRCTLQGIQLFYDQVRHKLRKGHLDALKKTPFKHFFKALHDDAIVREKKKDKILDNLILCYDRKTRKFKFGTEFYKPTRLDVKLIFGIEDGTEDVSAPYGRESKLASRHFANDGRVTIKKAKDKIKELVDNEDQESIDDVVKLLCLLILHNVLFSNTGARISREFLCYVDDLDRLNSYNWSQHVLDELMSGLQADWSNPKQVNGCILLLPYWFCEHLYKIPDICKNGKEEPMKTGEQGISSKGIPRLTKWKLNNLEMLVEKRVLYRMDKNEFNNNELIPTIAEEHLIKSLSVKQKAKNIPMENESLEQPPADAETLMDLMKRKYQIENRVEKNKQSSGDDAEEGSGVESGYSSEGNQESEAAQVEKRGFNTTENVEEPRNSSKGKSIAEARNVRDKSTKKRELAENLEKSMRKRELGETVTVLGKRKKMLIRENIKEKNGLEKDVEMKWLEEEISRLMGIVDRLKWEQVNLIGKQETIERALDEEVSKKTKLLCELEKEKLARKLLLNEMEIALDKEVSKKTKLLSELEKEKLARKELLNELALAKIKIEQQEDKAKEYESTVQNLQAYIQCLHKPGDQNFGLELLQQAVDQTMIESLGERVARIEKAMHEKDTTSGSNNGRVTRRRSCLIRKGHA